MKLVICTKFQVKQMNCVESRRGRFRLTPPPPSRLRVTIFSRRLLGLSKQLCIRKVDQSFKKIIKKRKIPGDYKRKKQRKKRHVRKKERDGKLLRRPKMSYVFIRKTFMSFRLKQRKLKVFNCSSISFQIFGPRL